MTSMVPIRQIPGGVAIDADAVLLALVDQQPRWAETLRTLARSEDVAGVELAIGLSGLRVIYSSNERLELLPGERLELLLGEGKDDDALRLVVQGDGDGLWASFAYPCRACGWARTCGPAGEDCHS